MLEVATTKDFVVAAAIKRLCCALGRGGRG